MQFFPFLFTLKSGKYDQKSDEKLKEFLISTLKIDENNQKLSLSDTYFEN